MCQLALCSKKIFGLVEQFSRNWLSLAENMFPNVSNIDTWFPYKLNFGAKIWEGGSSPSKKAGVYPCTSKIGCVQSSALVRRRDNGEHNWYNTIPPTFRYRVRQRRGPASGASFYMHAESRNLLGTPELGYIHFLKLICCLCRLCAILWYTLTISINLNMFELVRIYVRIGQDSIPKVAARLATPRTGVANQHIACRPVASWHGHRCSQQWQDRAVALTESIAIADSILFFHFCWQLLWTFMNREFMIISWPPKVLHALSIRCPLRSCLSSSHKCSSNRWDMVGGVNWLCRSIILHDPWIHRWLHRQGHTVGYRSDAAWTASRLPCLKKSLRWISCGTVTYSTVTYRPLLTRIRSQDSARLCGSMRCMWVTRCRILCRFGESWKFRVQMNSDKF